MRNRSDISLARQNELARQHKTRHVKAIAKTETEWRSRFLQGALLTTLASLMLMVSWSLANATEIQKVTSPSGIEAWLVEDHTVPIIAMDFAFTGGSTQDAPDKLGTVTMLTSLFDEGAADLDSEAFQTVLEENAIKLSFDTGRDRFYGSLRTLTPTRDQAFDLLAKALQSPRFDAGPIERMRAQWISQAKRAETNPSNILSRTFGKVAYPDHPYGRSSQGTVETLSAITRNDLVAKKEAIITRDGLIIGVVGAIDAKTLAPLLDKIFADLPEKGELKPVADVTIAETGEIHVPFSAPQTSIRFATPGIERDDPDFYAAYVVNHILGGGSFSSRLYTEIREKRGLAYGVYSYLMDMDHSNQFGGGMSTRTDNTEQALMLVKGEIARMAKEGPTAEELKSAKQFLTGSYALRFDSSAKIARQLVGIQAQNLGMDYFDKRNSYIEAVTLEDAKRVAKRLLKPENLLIVTVGQKNRTAKADMQ